MNRSQNSNPQSFICACIWEQLKAQRPMQKPQQQQQQTKTQKNVAANKKP